MPLPHETPALTGATAERLKATQTLVPELATSRLRLRAPHLEDFQLYADIILAPEGRFLTEDQTREAAWLDFAQMTSLWMLRGYGLWSIDDIETGALAGFVLIGFEPGDHEPELGYMIGADHRGRGFAAEAAAAVRDFAFSELGLDTLVSTIDHENTASKAVARKLGGVRDADAEAAHDHAIEVYRYRRESGL